MARVRYLVFITLEKGFYNIDVDGVQRGFAGNLYCIWTYVAEKSFLTELSNFDLSTNFLYYFSEKQIQDDWKVSNKAKFFLKQVDFLVNKDSNEVTVKAVFSYLIFIRAVIRHMTCYNLKSPKITLWVHYFVFSCALDHILKS